MQGGQVKVLVNFTVGRDTTQRPAVSFTPCSITLRSPSSRSGPGEEGGTGPEEGLSMFRVSAVLNSLRDEASASAAAAKVIASLP